MLCTAEIWNVKEGREDEFARRWEESASSLSREFPDVTFRLLRDRDDPRRFVSLGEGWRNVEQVEAARSLPGFQDSMASIWRMLEDGDIRRSTSSSRSASRRATGSSYGWAVERLPQLRRSSAGTKTPKAQQSLHSSSAARCVDECQRDLHHRVEVGDRDALVGVWMSVIPFARFTHESPRALKTFASAPPPESA